MAVALLTSEKFVKSVSNISDNLAGKYLLPSIREAQSIAFRGIVGDALYNKLCQLVSDEETGEPENVAYKDLLDKAQYFLAYSAIVEIVVKVSYKIGNLGTAKTQDDNVYTASDVEIGRQQEYYQSKADSCALDLQNWILDNAAAFPELTEGQCARISSNLYSSASCGIFLGGPRGRRLPKV